MLRFFEVFKVIFLKVFSASFCARQTLNVDASEGVSNMGWKSTLKFSVPMRLRMDQIRFRNYGMFCGEFLLSGVVSSLAARD
jgi:hypothetical protein